MDEKGNIELLNIIEVMEDALDAALRIPLSNGKCVVDAERFQELLSDMRLNLPTELKQAKNLLNDRKNILYIARKEAEDTVKLAEERSQKNPGSGRTGPSGSGQSKRNCDPGTDAGAGDQKGHQRICRAKADGSGKQSGQKFE